MSKYAPVSWQAPEAPGLVGDYAVNDQLNAARLIPTPFAGPEDVVVDEGGAIYTGTEDGSILRVTTGGEITTVARVGGRPLGIELYGDDLLVCNAELGLQRVTKAGTVELLADQFGADRLLFTNNASVADDGTVYFTDTSRRWGLADFPNDIIEASSTGRLFRRGTDGELSELVGGLAFANGVALDERQESVFVAESAKYRIQRHWLTGDRAGQTEIFIDNLPGFPDNLTFDDGHLWVGYASPRNPQVDRMSSSVWMKHVALRMPDALTPKPLRHGMIMGFTDDGTVVHNLQDSTGAIASTTTARIFNGSVYIGTLEDSHIAILDL